jgi:RNA polymerase sigma factor (sigma-70 family)
MIAHTALMEPSAHQVLPLQPRTHAASPQTIAGVDAELVARFARGDDAAFAELVAAHQDAAFSFARRLLGDGELARDVIQEAFLRILRHHRAYDPARPFRAWLLHIVRNLAIDALRRRRPHAGEAVLDQLAADPLGPSASERDELRDRVATVLAELPAKYRELIVMREMEGMPAEEIATIIGVDYGTTRWRLHKARGLFRDAWRARFGEDA